MLALLAGVAGCSDDFARFNGPLTTASLGIEPSNQDRIIRKTGAAGAAGGVEGAVVASRVRPGIKPVGVPDQSFPGETVGQADEQVSTYIAPAVEAGSLPPLKPSQPEPMTAEPMVEAAPVRRIEKTPVRAAKAEQPTTRKIAKPKLAAAGIPVVPPAPKAPGRLRTIGEPLTTGSVKRPAPTRQASGGTYEVVSGDTIYAIARRNGISSSELMAANGLSSASLKIGQRLTIPGASSVAAAPRREETRTVAAPASREPEKAVTTAVEPTPAETVRTVSPREPMRTEKAVETATNKGFAWPARGRILAGFGQRTPKGKNDGIDIALPEGTPVGAAADGIVLYAGSELEDFGNLVLVRHNDGWVSAYANASKNLVKRGDRVKKGQTIVRSGKSGNASEPQLHFELRRNSKPVDPERHLKG